MPLDDYHTLGQVFFICGLIVMGFCGMMFWFSQGWWIRPMHYPLGTACWLPAVLYAKSVYAERAKYSREGAAERYAKAIRTGAVPNAEDTTGGGRTFDDRSFNTENISAQAIFKSTRESADLKRKAITG